jgi:acyl-CoA thioester hydrolase
MTTDTAIVVAHPWLCDVMGHMNARHIYAAFDEAGFVLLEALGFGTAKGRHEGLGWADVRSEIEFQHEIPMGTVVRVRSQIARLGRKSFTHHHELVSSTNLCHAIARVTTVRFDLVHRKAVELPEDFAVSAKDWLVPLGAG